MRVAFKKAALKSYPELEVMDKYIIIKYKGPCSDPLTEISQIYNGPQHVKDHNSLPVPTMNS